MTKSNINFILFKFFFNEIYSQKMAIFQLSRSNIKEINFYVRLKSSFPFVCNFSEEVTCCLFQVSNSNIKQNTACLNFDFN